MVEEAGMNMPDTFVINISGEWLRMSEEQIPSVESAARKAGENWRQLRTRVISTNIILGMAEEYRVGLPEGVTKEEIEKGQSVLRDIYIRWAREAGEMDETAEKFLRGQITEEEFDVIRDRERPPIKIHLDREEK